MKDYFEEKHSVQKASRFMEDAFYGVKRAHPMQSQEAQWWYALHLRVSYVLTAVIWAYVLLTFFEQPVWCDRIKEERGVDPCRVYNGLYPTFNIPFLSRTADMLLELAFLSILSFSLYLMSRAYGRQLYDDKMNKAYASLLGLAILDFLWAYATPVTWFRFAPYIRIAILVVKQKEIQGQMLVIYRIMPSFGSICFLFFLFLFLFAWCGCIMFTDPSMRIEKEIFFPNLWEAMYTLMIFLTTNNSPNMFQPAFRLNRWAMLYYASFSLLVLFFGLNMITAIIYKEYNASRERDRELRMENRRENLKEAFKLLAEEDGDKISSKKIMEVFWDMNTNAEIEYIAEDSAKLLFAAADADGDDMLDETEFVALCDVLRVRFEEVKPLKSLEERFPKWSQRRWFVRSCHFVNTQYFEWIIDFLLMLNAIFVALETSEPLGFHGLPYKHNPYADTIEQLFSFLFVCEVIVKVMAKSWRGYWSGAGNRFDFLITVATVLASMYVYYPNAYNNTNLIKWFQVLRVLRAVRFLARMEGFRAICCTFAKMLGPASRLLKVLFIIMFLFSALGIQIFGGRLTRDPDSKYYEMLKDKAPDFTYPDDRYDFITLNFNDMWTSYVTLLVFLVANNWDVMVEGYVAVTSLWLRLYFVAFHFLGVYLCLNIVTSFIIDTAMEFYTESEDEKNKALIDGQTETSAGNVVFEAEVVTGSQNGLKGMYRAVVSDQSEVTQGAREVMNRMLYNRTKSMRSLSRMGSRTGDPFDGEGEGSGESSDAGAGQLPLSHSAPDTGNFTAEVEKPPLMAQREASNDVANPKTSPKAEELSVDPTTPEVQPTDAPASPDGLGDGGCLHTDGLGQDPSGVSLPLRPDEEGNL
ncbi:unnamed protein product [Ostreobium quekettii]|uniref:EF-hand domain-containing protein n=1 Tax=Ostreobium quekettii TaxID=121088 RepID=A0A8S1IVT2_9CHLO|nr:unnamed protein product [Ostreobium quekettii]